MISSIAILKSTLRYQQIEEVKLSNGQQTTQMKGENRQILVAEGPHGCIALAKERVWLYPAGLASQWGIMGRDKI